MENWNRYPAFVRTVHGGREQCSKTNRLHFQGAVQCKEKQRFSALKRWLPTAHLEPARDVKALKAYAMKADTAVGESKFVRTIVVVALMKFFRAMAVYVVDEYGLEWHVIRAHFDVVS